MLAECSICMDSLGGERVPVVMPCGHLYCLDCATFWFNQGDSQKCACGRVFQGEDIIRIWTTNEEGCASTSSSNQAPSQRLGNQALNACNVALTTLGMDVDDGDDAMVTALSR